ncbi:hypothetical protein [Geitlerinema sp. PCC 7407]|uniref:hypothetical protein n=1 Tax=Geitlerinema sp. PCC 7407 TaxID=1173025 RepID=UPI00029FB431|nr:hypothetical protein [Geitlerinema sp. PCC 7407]AFY68173.1 hypothetical protein GEI7407_3706 [Geitlerinema sp. PCC 7407]
MLLQHKETANLIKVVDPTDLFNPSTESIEGQIQAGQEEQDPTPFAKQELVFPSGEALPRCWLDPNYRQN